MEQKLLWLDLETTGLDSIRDVILEIYAAEAEMRDPFVTREIYGIVTHYSFAVHKDLGLSINPVVEQMHNENGLWDACERSTVSIQDAESALLSLLRPETTYVLAGNSVHFDLGFIRAYMPTLAKRLSHRCYDVSAIKMFCESIGMPPIQPKKAHRARADVEESIAIAKQCAGWVRE